MSALAPEQQEVLTLKLLRGGSFAEIGRESA